MLLSQSWNKLWITYPDIGYNNDTSALILIEENELIVCGRTSDMPTMRSDSVLETR